MWKQILWKGYCLDNLRTLQCWLRWHGDDNTRKQNANKWHCFQVVKYLWSTKLSRTYDMVTWLSEVFVVGLTLMWCEESALTNWWCRVQNGCSTNLVRWIKHVWSMKVSSRYACNITSHKAHRVTSQFEILYKNSELSQEGIKIVQNE
jgi:hypothetical protein